MLDRFRLLNNCSHLLQVQSTSLGRLFILAKLCLEIFPEVLPTLVTAELTRRFKLGASRLAAWFVIGTKDTSSDLVVVDGVETAKAPPSREPYARLGAFRADIALEELDGIVFINTNTGAMIPIVAVSLTGDHSTVIVRSTANTVFASIIRLIICKTRCAASLSRTGWSCR
jgi:hypothetical protein